VFCTAPFDKHRREAVGYDDPLEEALPSSSGGGITDITAAEPVGREVELGIGVVLPSGAGGDQGLWGGSPLGVTVRVLLTA